MCNRVEIFPDNELLRNLETWWLHPLAVDTDKHTCAVISLRQRLVSAHDTMLPCSTLIALSNRPGDSTFRSQTQD